MATVTIRVGNYATISGQIKGKLNTFALKVGNAVQGAGIDCQALAKQNCPVDTGRLRSSIQYKKTSALSCTVGTNVKYARPVEFGHVTRNHKSHVPARPFLFPSYIDTKKGLMTELKALVA